MGRKKIAVSQQLKSYCYMLNIAQDGGFKPCGYQLQKKLGQLPKQLKTDALKRNNKYDRYFVYKNKTPSCDTLGLIRSRFPDNDYILHLLLWDGLAINEQEAYYIDLLIKMPAQIKHFLFKKNSAHELKSHWTYRDLSAIERIATNDALAALIIILQLQRINEGKYVTEIPIYEHLYRLLIICTLTSPLNLIESELFDVISGLLIKSFEHVPQKFKGREKERFIALKCEMNNMVKTISHVCQVETGTQRREIRYWLINSNRDALILDMNCLLNHVPLSAKSALHSFFLKIKQRARGLSRQRMEFLLTEMISPKHYSPSSQRPFH